MSVWTTRSQNRDRNYVVLQHSLRGVNYVVNGVRFRDSYAVVEKGSKTYSALKRVPVLRSAKEFPLTHLAKLAFISRQSDIKTVYGQDVYLSYLKAKDIEDQERIAAAEITRLEDEDRILKQREEELRIKMDLEQKAKEALKAGDVSKAKEIEATIPDIAKCSHRNEKGDLCGKDAYEFSPSGWCGTHLLEDPRLQEFGIEEKPKYLTKDEVKAFREKAKEVLKRAKKQGKF